MRIGIDASWACGQRTGTGEFCRGLVECLVGETSPHDFILYFRGCCRDLNPLFSIQRPRVQARVVNGRTTVGRTLFGLSRALRKDRVDVLISPAYFLPLYGPRRSVVAFLDMNLYTLPGTRLRRGTWMDFLVMRALCPLWLRLADHVVTISRSTQDDLARLFPRAARKASIIYPPFAPSRLLATADQPGRMGSRPYFFYVGVMAPSKNLERLIRAFHRFRSETSTDTALVLAGRECGEHMAGVLQPLIHSLGLTRDVVWAGVVDDNERSALYRGATAVAFPSLREGFGYPIVEGMAAGVPVITSNVSSCAEVAGDAALLVDPYSVEAIAGALRRIVEDGLLRERLVAAGRRRCDAFAPQAVARQYLALAERLDAEGRSRDDR